MIIHCQDLHFFVVLQSKPRLFGVPDFLGLQSDANIVEIDALLAFAASAGCLPSLSIIPSWVHFDGSSLALFSLREWRKAASCALGSEAAMVPLHLAVTHSPRS